MALQELGLAFTADAVQHSDVSESATEIRFLAPVDTRLSMDARDLQKAVLKAVGRPLKVAVTFGAPQTAGTGTPQAKTTTPSEDEVAQRALGHPEVQRFQELFPDAHVRAVRNLKE